MRDASPLLPASLANAYDLRRSFAAPHYVELLKAEADPIKREMLERLLAEEKAKAAGTNNM
jgi:predicted phosphatase